MDSLFSKGFCLKVNAADRTKMLTWLDNSMFCTDNSYPLGIVEQFFVLCLITFSLFDMYRREVSLNKKSPSNIGVEVPQSVPMY